MFAGVPISPLSLNSGSPTGLIHLKRRRDHSSACLLFTDPPSVTEVRTEWMEAGIVGVSVVGVVLRGPGLTSLDLERYDL